MVCLLAFINIPQVGVFKFVIMGGFSIPALISLFMGAVICRFQNWKYSIGIVLLSSVGFNLLVVIAFISILLTTDLHEFFPDNNLASFNDYLSGFSLMFFLAGLGCILLMSNKRKIAESAAALDVSVN